MDPHLRGDDDLFWGGTTSIEMTITPTPSATHRSCRWHSLWIPAFAGMTNDTTAIILDPSVAGTNHTGNTTESTWSVTFPNYTISGIASCNNIDGKWATAYPEYNDVFTPGQTTGPNCWCRMLKPVRSAWVFYDTFSSASECATKCASYCGNYVRFGTSFRSGLFSSAGQ